jgi:hypothetical protein
VAFYKFSSGLRCACVCQVLVKDVGASSKYTVYRSRMAIC